VTIIALIAELTDALAQLVRGHLSNNAEEERIALLRFQRAISNEIARREAES
jgi:hypothetical protein